MAIEPIESTNTPNEGRVIINDNFIDIDGRINEIDPNGLAWHFGAGAPLDTVGFDGDMYFATDTGTYYGPKVDGAWPSSGVVVSAVPDATESDKGKAEIATQVETDAGTDDARIVTPLKLANYSGLGGVSDAVDVTFTPAGTIAATDVQAAIEEVATEASGGSFSGDAGDVLFTPAGTIAATDVQAAIEEVASEAGGSVSSASETTAGIAEIATQTETNTGTDDTRIVTPLKFAGRTSTETRAGVVELATDTETQTGTDTARAITPANLSARSATETRSGVAEVATQTETDTGTDDNRIVTPLKAATRFLAKAGGTLTGFLTLHADPTSALHAVTKQYADGLVSGGASPASETVAGIAEIATQTETNTGTDDTRIVTPAKLANYTGLSGGSGYTPPWVHTGSNALYGAWGEGNPSALIQALQTTATPTPTNISTTVIRFVRFRLPVDLLLTNVYLIGAATVNSIYTVGIYPAAASSSKLWDNGGGTINSIAGWTVTTTSLPVLLTANTDYLWCVGASTTGTTGGFYSPSQQSNFAPFWGNSATGPFATQQANIGLPQYGQFATTAGAMPGTLPTISAAGPWTGTVPTPFLVGTAS